MTLVALHTPGHSPDHMAFGHEDSRTVFVGDLVDYLASLERIRALRPSRLLPAHGPSIDDPDRLLTRAIEHRMTRERQVLVALAAGAGTVQVVTESIYHGLHPALLAAAHETVRAHLEKLRREGRAFVDADRWSSD